MLKINRKNRKNIKNIKNRKNIKNIKNIKKTVTDTASIKGDIKKTSENDIIIALAGNPNVGKSTVFNNLTGMRQHTGNWPGKTVECAYGRAKGENGSYVFVDLPGTYSLAAHSVEEEVARNFIYLDRPALVVAVCDATCLERNLNLTLQLSEAAEQLLVCVNLIDEAKRRHIELDCSALSDALGVPVVGISARDKQSGRLLLEAIDRTLAKKNEQAAAATYSPVKICYPEPVERALAVLSPCLEEVLRRLDPDGGNGIARRARRLSILLLERDRYPLQEPSAGLQGAEFFEDAEVKAAFSRALEILAAENICSGEELTAIISQSTVRQAEEIAKRAVRVTDQKKYAASDRKIDAILTGRVSAFPLMLLFLTLILWLTVSGANLPSRLLADGLFFIQDRLCELFTLINAPEWLHGALIHGVYRMLAWVISVMLPPMAIFFPLFTLLEDAGYLPRIAYNLDKPFSRCGSCGKQALTMCMGFGCNAVGVSGCRIISSPRERLLAVLTNSFVPCNGRFPTIIAIISMFLISSVAGGSIFSSIYSALLLTLMIVLGVLMTFFVTKVLSRLLPGNIPSAFSLELPPYRMPRVGQVIVRSLLDRTLFVLGRAAAVAAPAGLLIWLMANTFVSEISLLSHCAGFLDPVARLLGLDGVILLAFILGFPANEVVIPIIIMAYTSNGMLTELPSLSELQGLLAANGWTGITAVCTMLFSLFHWPCSTTLLTVKKETGGLKWTALAAALPTLVGIVLCAAVAFIGSLF